MEKNLTSLNLSYTTCIDWKKFVTYILPVLNLQRIRMNSCKQFTEESLCQIVNYQTKLEHVEMYKCTQIRFCNILNVLTQNPMIKSMHFDMRYGMSDVKNWARLRTEYPNVDLGTNVKKLLDLYHSGQL